MMITSYRRAALCGLLAGTALAGPAALAAPCTPPEGEAKLRRFGEHFPGIFIASSNLPLNLPDPADYAEDPPEGVESRAQAQARRDLILSCIWDDPRVLGGNVIVPWSKFDRGPDFRADGFDRRYDWAWADGQIDLWRARGKKVNLLLWGSSQQTKQEFLSGGFIGTPGERRQSATPQWLFDMNVPTVTCDPDGPDGTLDESGDNKAPLPLTPIHNDPAVRTAFQEAARAFYDRYKDRSYVNYVRFGAGVGSENYPLNFSNPLTGLCRDEWEAAGGGDGAAWRSHVQTQVRFFAELQNEGDVLVPAKTDPDPRAPGVADNAPIVVSLNDFKIEKNPDGSPNGVALPQAILNEARQRLLGVGTQGPTDKSRRQYEAGARGACSSNWCNVFDQARLDPRVPVLEIQTPNASGPRGLEPEDGTGSGFTRTGPLDTLVPFLVDRGVTSFELYNAEFRIANDADNAFAGVYNAVLSGIQDDAVVNAKRQLGEPVADRDPSGRGIVRTPALQLGGARTGRVTGAGGTIDARVTGEGLGRGPDGADQVAFFAEAIRPDTILYADVNLRQAPNGAGGLMIRFVDPGQPEDQALAALQESTFVALEADKTTGVRLRLRRPGAGDNRPVTEEGRALYAGVNRLQLRLERQGGTITAYARPAFLPFGERRPYKLVGQVKAFPGGEAYQGAYAASGGTGEERVRFENLATTARPAD